MSTNTLVCILLGFLSVLTAYVVLTLNGQDPSGLVSVVITLLGVTGLGAHIEARTQQQNRTIAKIDQQTNGVLTQRIHDGTKAAVEAVLAERDSAAAEVTTHTARTTVTKSARKPRTAHL